MPALSQIATQQRYKRTLQATARTVYMQQGFGRTLQHMLFQEVYSMLVHKAALFK